MTQKDLAVSIATKLGTTQKAVNDVLNSLSDEIVNGLKSEGKIQTNFGVFELKNRKARTARVPGTDRTVEVPAKRVPVFKPSKGLKEAVK